MRYLKAEPEDFQAIGALWQRVFSDNAQDVAEMLEYFVGHENQFVAKEGDDVCAILSAVPCFCGETNGVYLFALATKPEVRGRGVMAKLMQFAEASAKAGGAEFALLVPANEPLFEYYEKHGYNQHINAQVVDWQVGTTPARENALEVAKASELGKLRDALLKQNTINFNRKSTQIIYNDLAFSGVQIYKADRAYAVVRETGKGLQALEFAAENDSIAEKFLFSLCKRFKTDKIKLSLAVNSPLFTNRQTTQKYALAKSLAASKNICEFYFRFALDDYIIQ